MSHLCHATGCKTAVPPVMFMCKTHWFKLPGTMRAKIWAAYRPGQCDDWNPSADYCRAAKEAVVYLAKIESREPDTRIYDMFLRRDV